VGIADVINHSLKLRNRHLCFFPLNKSLGTPKFGRSQLRASLSAFQSPRRICVPVSYQPYLACLEASLLLAPMIDVGSIWEDWNTSLVDGHSFGVYCLESIFLLCDTSRLLCSLSGDLKMPDIARSVARLLSLLCAIWAQSRVHIPFPMPLHAFAFVGVVHHVNDLYGWRMRMFPNGDRPKAISNTGPNAEVSIDHI